MIRRQAPRAKDLVNRRYRHRGVMDEIDQAKNRTKSKVRAKVERSIGVIKRVFGFTKVRYRGLANLLIARRHHTPLNSADVQPGRADTPRPTCRCPQLVPQSLFLLNFPNVSTTKADCPVRTY